MTEQEPVLAGMGTASWSAEDGVAYEVALEGINHVVGAYSGLIAQARKAGDSARVDELLAEQSAWSAKRGSLGPEDRAGVDALTAESAQALERLRSTP
ncbi:hypothetical protein [Streptomyces sp. NBC_00209]|uniref:hypothetical protein n=1 Tax=Streptomyces sp. NBC_00209 TaxID=2975682 RepID=UPI002F91753F